MSKRIKQVLCEDQIPSNIEGPMICVGYKGITEIRENQENLGTYGIVWFEGYKNEQCIVKLNAAYVMRVEYFDE